jgi:hypothetical protein
LPITREAWSTAWRLLNQGQRLRHAEIIADDLFQLEVCSPLSQRMSRPVMQLINSVEQFDIQGLTQAAEKLIGLGPGVTPSGDDILIGFLAGLWSTAGQNQIRLSFVRLLGNEIIRIAKLTSEISRTYLYHAAQGRFSSSLSRVVEAIATGTNLEPVTREALQVGHSSGMDSVTGLLIGLRLWNLEPSFVEKVLHIEPKVMFVNL